ncbi:MAG: hypothetical protein GF311_14480 [Candidatus Lokiarchaeota archaeon]|nr:hypothetical protein [Candidatus Lokiarchaeota archaeon]
MPSTKYIECRLNLGKVSIPRIPITSPSKPAIEPRAIKNSIPSPIASK